MRRTPHRIRGAFVQGVTACSAKCRYVKAAQEVGVLYERRPYRTPFGEWQ